LLRGSDVNVASDPKQTLVTAGIRVRTVNSAEPCSTDAPLLWRVPEGFPAGAIGEYDRRLGPEPSAFRTTRRQLGQAALVVRFEAPSLQLSRYDCLPNDVGVPLVDEAVSAVLLEICPDDVQLLPVKVVARGVVLDGFSFVNVLCQVDAIDPSGTESFNVPGTDILMGFNRLAHRPGALGGRHLAREIEYPPHVLVSTHLSRRIKSLGRLPGVEFIAANAMRW